jgi:hypothetical protein
VMVMVMVMVMAMVIVNGDGDLYADRSVCIEYTRCSFPAAPHNLSSPAHNAFLQCVSLGLPISSNGVITNDRGIVAGAICCCCCC